VNSSKDSSWDIFICYDTRDLEDIARPLYHVLTNKKIKAWLYEERMKGGDSIVQGIHRGIMSSDNSVIIVTQNFLTNDRWARSEFEMIVQDAVRQQKKIFTIWYKVTADEVMFYNLRLAIGEPLDWERGVDEVSNELIFRMKEGLSNG
jgi:hypothetical protein